MDERKKIEERLQKKEAEIQALEDRLKAARIYAQALTDVLKLLDSAVNTATAPSSQPVSESSLRSGSAVDQARQVILARQEPVHISALLEALGKDTSRESRASLTSSLAAYVRRGEIFTRTAPNTFGLIELGHQTVEGDEDELPSGFGRVLSAAPAGIRRAPPPPPPPPKHASDVSDEIDDDIPF